MWDHDVAQDDRVVVGPEHLGDREAIDVGVEQADAVSGLGQCDGEVHRDRRLADAALARRHPDDPGGGIGPRKAGIGPLPPCPCPVRARRGRRDRCRARCRRPRREGTVAQHPGTQALAEPGPLAVGHHHEFELDLLDPRHGAGGPVDVLRQVVGAGPRGHRQGHLDQNPAAAGAHGPDEAELTERQPQLGLSDRAQRSLEL